VVNLNVPNMPLSEMRGWRHADVGILPPRAMAEATLEPVAGHEGAFHVRMSWGEEISLAEGTDGGTIERDMIAITYLSRMAAEPRADLEKADAALDNLFS
jgi:broad specificity polyphosphatase/5'/3'-nucleotidase SurE